MNLESPRYHIDTAPLQAQTHLLELDPRQCLELHANQISELQSFGSGSVNIRVCTGSAHGTCDLAQQDVAEWGHWGSYLMLTEMRSLAVD